MTHTFRFAVDLQAPLPDTSWTDSAREIEGLGYSTAFVPDHFDEGLGPITAMAAAATVTTSLRIGALVMACDFRHPAVVARELASIDQISEGRLEVGLGAGWKRADYDRSGIPMDPPKVRVDRMIEHVTVLKGLFAPGPFTFAGDHYTITELDGTPKPYNEDGPPFLIGGGGRRVLGYAARTADIVGVNPSIHSGEVDVAAAQDALPASIDEKVEWVRSAAAERINEIEINEWLSIAMVTDDAMGVAEAFAGAFAATPDQVLESPMTLIGSASEIVERLHARRERWGYSYVVIPHDQVRDFAPIVAELTGI